MSFDSGSLWDAANGLAGILQTAGTNAGFDFETCVTPVEPSWDCMRIHVWPGQINAQQIKCNVTLQTTLAYGIALCIGAEKKEDCGFWNRGDKTESALNVVWGIYAGLADALTPTSQGGLGTLCPALGGSPCNETIIGPLNTFESGDFVVYGGIVTFRLDIVRT